MKKLLLSAFLMLSAACLAQGGYIHGNGDPSTLNPVPNCAGSRFYIDDSTGKLYQASYGSPCAWTESGSNILPSGATADYKFLNGSGNSVTDLSGNGNNATLEAGAAAPVWVTSGLSFSGARYLDLPASLNGTMTYAVGMYIPALTAVNYSGLPNNGVQSIILDSTGPSDSFAIQLSEVKSAFSALTDGTYSPSTYGASSCAGGHGYNTGTHATLSGYVTLIYTLGVSGTSLDHIYVNGKEVTYSFQGATCPLATGHLKIGAFQGTLYRAIFYPTALTSAQAVLVNAAITQDIAARGVSTAPALSNSGVPQLFAIGDSITYGQGVTTTWENSLTLTNQQPYVINNTGISGITMAAITATEPNRLALQCASSGGSSVAIVFAGTNDYIFGALTSAQIWARTAAEINTLKNAGCQVYVGTMLSRTGNTGSLGITYDAAKNQLDAFILTGANAAGADGIVDFAADPNLGADGANTSATWFQSDHVHPTQAGQTRMGVIASNSLNYYNGFTLANPDVVTATTYTLTSGDRAVTAAPTANAAYTMPDCTGPSGEVYTISNPQSTYTLTITGGTNQPINGLTSAITISSNATVTLHDVANPKTTSGCHWVM